MKAYRHADGSIWTLPARPQRRARLQRSRRRLGAAGARRTEYFLQAARASSSRSTVAWVPSRRRRRASICGRSCSPRRPSSASAPRRRSRYMRDRQPRRRLLHRAASSRSRIWLSEEYARAGTRRHRRGQDRRQLRVEPARRRARPRERAATRCVFLNEAGHYVEELGGMNIVLRLRRRLASSRPESGSILEGITRDSLLQLAGRTAATPSSERPVSDRRVARGRGVR